MPRAIRLTPEQKRALLKDKLTMFIFRWAVLSLRLRCGRFGLHRRYSDGSIEKLMRGMQMVSWEQGRAIREIARMLLVYGPLAEHGLRRELQSLQKRVRAKVRGIPNWREASLAQILRQAYAVKKPF